MEKEKKEKKEKKKVMKKVMKKVKEMMEKVKKEMEKEGKKKRKEKRKGKRRRRGGWRRVFRHAEYIFLKKKIYYTPRSGDDTWLKAKESLKGLLYYYINI